MEWVVSVTPWTRFTPGERTPGTHCTGGWVGPRAGLDTEDRGKILFFCRGSNSGRPARSQTLHRLSYPSSLINYINNTSVLYYKDGDNTSLHCDCSLLQILVVVGMDGGRCNAVSVRGEMQTLLLGFVKELESHVFWRSPRKISDGYKVNTRSTRAVGRTDWCIVMWWVGTPCNSLHGELSLWGS
jgi:hypothetical protein